ncbi:hypothetical protein [Sphingomicrobium nitratireducens]|uniref:hypothetical protein n=1 Tax=Sphingomicrobium nitratireducens TaxID=2964666 RepID=UPI002240B0B8|nr:hypothetical protein [Sphingomicrobium nitratireducens]
MKLSVGRAWDETREILAADGKHLVLVAAAMIVLPFALLAMIDPSATNPNAERGGGGLMGLIVGLVGQAGALAITAVFLKRGATVGEAIATGFRKLFPALAAMLIWVIPMVLLLMVLLVAAIGTDEAMDLDQRLEAGQLGGAGLMLVLAWVLVIIAVAVRMMMVSAVAVTETSNPITMIKRSWALTRGQFWRLFGFVLMIAVAALVVMLVAGLVFGLVATLAFGPPEPMSLSALLLGFLAASVQAGLSLVFLGIVARLYSQAAATPSVPDTGAMG